MSRKPLKLSCPNCGERNMIASIQYGFPVLDEKLNRDLNDGRVVLGGCEIYPDQPEFECSQCKHRWSRANSEV